MALAWAAATLILIVGVGLVLSLLAAARAGTEGSRLQQLVAAGPQKAPAAPGAPQAARLDTMPTVTKLLGGGHLTERLLDELTEAGMVIRPSEFIGIMAGVVIVTQIAAILVYRTLLGHVLFGLIGVAVPVLVLMSKQQKRRAAFESQIPNALLLIASSLRSGFSFPRAMQMIAQEMPPPISQEFQRVLDETNVGRSLQDALGDVVKRVQSYDFDLVVTAVLIQLSVGGNLADVLEAISATIRERVQIMGEMRSLTVEGKLSGIIMLLLPIFLGLALSVMNPDYMSVMFEEPLGRLMLGVGAVFQVLGALVIKKMLVLDI
jgi:tight adherence protein B